MHWVMESPFPDINFVMCVCVKAVYLKNIENTCLEFDKEYFRHWVIWNEQCTHTHTQKA